MSITIIFMLSEIPTIRQVINLLGYASKNSTELYAKRSMFNVAFITRLS